MVELFDLRSADLAIITRELRSMDRFEFDVMSQGKPLDQCFDHLQRRSIRSRAAYVNGRLVAVYGVLAPTLLSDVGNPWLAATSEIDKPEVRRAFVAHTEQEMRWLCQGFQRLWNVVSCENHIAIRWLKWIGFQFDSDTIDVRGHAFRRFSLGE